MFPRSFIIISFSILLFNLPAQAQVIESSAEREKMFVFEVKHIDEFMERFNFEQNSLIISYVKMNYPGVRIDKGSLVTNLFNRQNKNWIKSDVDSFFNQVISPAHPVELDFYSNRWYAEAVCVFMYKGKPAEVILVLRIQQVANGGAKWVITGAHSRALPILKTPAVSLTDKPGFKFLNPMSHATNFMSLSGALSDKSNIRDYLDSGFFDYPASLAFINALLKNQLQYNYVKKITYHFLQVDGWIFTVNNFNRKSVNSGWLISRLQRATEQEKIAYRNLLLYKN